MKKSALTIEPVIQSSWKTKTKKVKSHKDGYHRARDWQARGYKELKDKTLRILNAPTGSGKTCVMMMLGASNLLDDIKLRLVIAVPQTLIGNGFLKESFILPDTKEKIDWKPTHNLLNGTEESNVSYLIDFLSKRSTSKTPLNDRILLCTHATLVNLQKVLYNTKRLDLLRNLMVWIDEGHHSKNADMADDTDVVISNGIGQFVQDLMNARRRNVHIGLATASFFRGDRCTVLTEEMESKFTRFNLAYDEYFETLQHLKSLSVGFVFSPPNYIGPVAKIVASRRGKDIVIFPHPIHRHSRGDKLKDVADFHKELAKIYGSKRTVDENGVVTFQPAKGKSANPILLEADRRPYRTIDLVDESNREVKKEFTQRINDDRDMIDCITTIGMFREGANWVYADRAIIVGHRESYVEIVQTIGRLLRDCPSKEHVEVVIVLPWSFDQSDREEFRKTLNNYLKTVYAYMLLEDVMMPPDITEFDASPRKPGTTAGRFDPVIEYIPDFGKRTKVMDAVADGMIRLSDETNRSARFDDHVANATAICKKMGVEAEHAPAVARRLILKHLRKTLQTRGVDVEKIDIELVHSVDPAEWILDFTTRNCNVVTFRELRRRLSTTGTNYPPLEVIQKYWQDFLKQNPGVKNTAKNYMKWANGGFQVEQPKKTAKPTRTRRPELVAASI